MSRMKGKVSSANVMAYLRTKMQMTQEAFSDALGISRISVSSTENGRTEPSFKTVLKALEISRPDLFQMFVTLSELQNGTKEVLRREKVRDLERQLKKLKETPK